MQRIRLITIGEDCVPAHLHGLWPPVPPLSGPLLPTNKQSCPRFFFVVAVSKNKSLCMHTSTTVCDTSSFPPCPCRVQSISRLCTSRRGLAGYKVEGIGSACCTPGPSNRSLHRAPRHNIRFQTIHGLLQQRRGTPQPILLRFDATRMTGLLACIFTNCFFHSFAKTHGTNSSSTRSDIGQRACH
jgi:hypothetical protein